MTFWYPLPNKKRTKQFNHNNVKGQFISKCLFGTIVSTKTPTNFFLRISALASKKRSNQKSKGTSLYKLGVI